MLASAFIFSDAASLFEHYPKVATNYMKPWVIVGSPQQVGSTIVEQYSIQFHTLLHSMESFNPSGLTTYTEVRASDVNELHELHGLYKALAKAVRGVTCAEEEVKRTAVQRTDESRKLVSHGSHYLPEGPALALLGRRSSGPSFLQAGSRDRQGNCKVAVR